MSFTDGFRAALSALEATLKLSAELADDASGDHRREGIKLRRQLAEQIGSLGAIGEKAFEEPNRREDFRRELSTMRAAMALHQASYPMVSIDRNDPRYITSLRVLRDTNHRFFTWANSTLRSLNER